jgi:hypothetical protein
LDHAYAVDNGLGVAAPRPDYRVILGDRVLENYMAARIDNVSYLLAAYNDLHRLVEDILESIDTDLES